MRRSARGVAVAVLAALLSGASAAPAHAQPTSSAAAAAAFTGGGDLYFPAAGNRGYDVRNYDLALDYTPTTKALTATAVIAATATQQLTRFSLDLRNLTVASVDVNGTPARFVKQGGELIVTPAQPLPPQPFVVTVKYSGTMGRPKDNTGSLYGWVAFKDGAFVGNEPEGASTWYPVNDVSYDKASYTFAITVPQGTVGVGNGKLLSQATQGTKTTYRWAAMEPMASYLSMAASGNYTLTTSAGPHALPIVNAVDKDLDAAAVAKVLDLQPEMITFFEGRFGPYPFGSFGAVVDDDDKPGYALENQARPIYSGMPNESTADRDLNTPATTDDFKALAEQVSGKQLDDLFQAWLYTPGRPADPRSGPAAPAGAGAVARTAATADAPPTAGADAQGSAGADVQSADGQTAAAGAAAPHQRR